MNKIKKLAKMLAIAAIVAILFAGCKDTSDYDSVLDDDNSKVEISDIEKDTESEEADIVDDTQQEEQQTGTEVTAKPEETPQATPAQESEKTPQQEQTVPLTEVPNVIGMKEQAAVDTLKAAGFNSAVAHSVHETAQRGTIFQQDQAGQTLPTTETILLWVSDGTSEYTLERAARKEAEQQAAAVSLSSEARLKYIRIMDAGRDYMEDENFSPDVYEYSVEKNGDSYVCEYEPMHSGAKVDVKDEKASGGGWTDDSRKISLTVTAEDGTTKTYIILIYIDPPSM